MSISAPEVSMIELRFWHQNQARGRYDELRRLGHACNMSADGRGVLVRLNLKNETTVTENKPNHSYLRMT